MLVQKINNQYNQNFGMRFRLSKETIKTLETSTGLTYKEMTGLSIDETTKLMKERGKLKGPSKLKIWISDKYKIFGEKLGLLQKEYKIYTDID
ncbi:hypothetical protein J6G99_08605 [bacterium]|nr:hypothetical protein [bacterium]